MNGLNDKEYIEYITNTQIKNKQQVKILQQKALSGQKIRIGFFVVYFSTMGSKLIFEKIRNDDFFDTKLVIIPDSSRGTSNLVAEVIKCYKEAVEQYGNDVIIPYDTKNNSFFSIAKNFDIIFFSNPYDFMTAPEYGIAYAAFNGILTIYTQYGYQISNFSEEHFFKSPTINFLWKYYLESKLTYKHYLENSIAAKLNGRFLGYSKLDALASISPKQHSKKRIIITSHHTVGTNWIDKGFNLSNFLSYANFYIKLASHYKDIDFIFRPHPLLFTTLVNDHIWTKQQIDNYKKQIEDTPNLFLDETSDYFDLFVNSDAMINDCGSFIIEYMVTGHPQCFLSKGEEIDTINLNEFLALKCIDKQYKATKENEIIKFIEEVVIKNNDTMKEERMNFVKENILGEYPHSTELIITDIKQSILKGE